MTTVHSNSFANMCKSQYVLTSFAPIEIIQDDHISKDIIDKFKRAGFCTVSSLAFVTKEKLRAKISDLDELLIFRIHTKVAEIIGLDFVVSQAVFQPKPTHITTGSLALDNLLGGGLELGRVHQVFGESEISKRQFCLSTALTCQLPYVFGGGFAKSIYITPFLSIFPSISANCVMAFTQKYKTNIDEVTNNIFLLSANTADELTKAILQAKYMTSKDRYAVLIVDTIITYYNGLLPVVCGITEDIIPQFFDFLKLLAREHNCAIVVTDRTIGLPIGFELNEIRLLLKDSTDASHIECKIIGPNGIEEQSTAFSLSNGLISDIQENN